MNKLMTAAEVAEYAQVNVRTVYRKARDGELQCYRMGKAIRFKLDEVEASMKGGKKCQKRRNEAPKRPRM